VSATPEERIALGGPRPTPGPAELALEELLRSSDQDPFDAWTADEPAVVNGATIADTSQSATDFFAAYFDHLNAGWVPWAKRWYQVDLWTWWNVVSGDESWQSEQCWYNDATGTKVYIVVTADTQNSWYCPGYEAMTEAGEAKSGIILFGADSLSRLWGGDIFGRQARTFGDFSASVLIAHEFGHHLVDELYPALLKTNPDLKRPGGKWGELIADCLAGISAYVSYSDGYLEDGDFEEALEALYQLGDTNVTSPQHHGTPDERTRAFRVGYAGLSTNPQGEPIVPVPASFDNCFQEFWKVEQAVISIPPP
jgi:hypothetical protein